MTDINHPYKANEEKVARSGATNLRISTKNSVEISRFIKGLGVEKAMVYLSDVVKVKKAIPYKRFIRDQAHRKGGMGPGRFPVNAAIEFLKLLKNAKSNAEVKGLDGNNLVVDNAQANIGSSRFHRGARSFGRRRAKSTNVSITVKEQKVKKTKIVTKKEAVKAVKPKAVSKAAAQKATVDETKEIKKEDVKDNIKK
ncbi:MAG: 50S ribosomal protein L22 [Nanohaloarchaea archaeon]|nr:50S ribosomal protein L22 [Candidatus Nanohaloarchaea archaeon]